MVDLGEMAGVLLAYSSTWQALVGAATPNEALEFIQQYQAEDRGEDIAPYPRAIVQESEESRGVKGTASKAGGSGALLVSIECEVPDAHVASVSAQRAWFVDQIRNIQNDMLVTSISRATPTGYTHSHLQVREISWAVEPFLLPIADRQDLDVEDDTPLAPLWLVQLRVEY